MITLHPIFGFLAVAVLTLFGLLVRSVWQVTREDDEREIEVDSNWSGGNK
jgi:hypothetical protein